MTIWIACAACGRRLTAPCGWGNEADHSFDRVDREPAVTRGRLVRLVAENACDTWQNGRIVGRHVFSPAGAIAANPEDVPEGRLESVGMDPGCCGSDGWHGPNRACVCGAIVATEWSDCFTQAEVRFLPDAVVASDGG